MIDYAKAYDTVWRDALYLKMCRLKIPSKLIKWVQQWMTNRRAWVNYDNTTSRVRVFTKGLPQGAALSPLLFAIFINDLPNGLPKGVTMSLFADDAAMWAQSSSVDEAKTLLQQGLDHVSRWSKKWRLTISEAKCEGCLFTNSNTERALDLELTINNSALQQTPNPKFLGVTYDPGLTFSTHVENTIDRANSRGAILHAVRGTDWGWAPSVVRNLYITCIRPVLEYASPAWGPWLSKTNQLKVERCQRKHLRTITGLPKSCPVDALMIEADMTTLRTRVKRAAAVALEKSLRLPTDHPRHSLSLTDVPRRLDKPDWLSQASRPQRGPAGSGEGPLRRKRSAPGQDPKV